MTRQDIYIEKYEWDIIVFHDVRKADADVVCGALVQIGCTGKALVEAREHILRGEKNCGLTYSNVSGRSSVVVISEATSEGEKANTIAHELLHVVTHVCEHDGIDMTTEEPCYMLGWLFQSITNHLNLLTK